MKAITTDGRELECETVEERDHGVALYDADRQQIGYVPYERFKYAIRLRTPVASTSIRSVGYDDEDDRLEIEFHSGGVYQYLDVPERVYTDLLGADSRGRYFHDEIRGQYSFRQLR